uniref:Activity-dependent neuroprotector homeobox protein n=1 Tax=Denticeps clupeoides TaxID=299321 RepID=A0AAY4CW43_9TELE
MFQLPVNNLGRIRKARKGVKKVLSDIGLEYCKEHVEDFKEFGPDDNYVNSFSWEDVCPWYPQKTQDYRSKLFCCSECPFASKYFSGYKNHFRNVHREDYEKRILLNCSYCMYTGNKRALEIHVRLFHASNSAHHQSQARQMGVKDGSQQSVYYCKRCSFQDALYNVVRRHIYREHFQHLATAYIATGPESMPNSDGLFNPFNVIKCKSCEFTPHSYEALVQHVVEYHEKFGRQVTLMIGHKNIPVSRPHPHAGSVTPVHVWSSQATQQVSRLGMPKIGALQGVDQPKHVPVGVQLSTGALVFGACDRKVVKKPPSVSTAQTQKWKVCTVCSQLFPENTYSAHFEKEHQAEKVRVMAKYIMKIHNFTSKCLYCNRYLPSDTLLSHLLIHGVSCPVCHVSFNEVEKIVTHKRHCFQGNLKDVPGEAPLTFELTVQLDKPRNVQLIVTTYNMKDPPVNTQTSPDPANSAQVNMPDHQNDCQILPQSEVGKTVCPLCFSILKGPIFEELALHLRERHQVIQTLHPVEKKMTFKCIHCLGVYTSTMTASTITLHLVHCRGMVQQGQVTKPFTSLHSPGVGTLKRGLTTANSSDPKKRKVVDLNPYTPTVFVEDPEDPVTLALDPKGHAEKPYEARKVFLTAYFNCRPYPSQREMEKLAASLWLWKSDVTSHFANCRRSCERDFVSRRSVVLFGFNMRIVHEVQHCLNFGPEWYFKGTVEDKMQLSKTSRAKLWMPQTVRGGPKSLKSKSALIPRPDSYQQPISSDSDSDVEIISVSNSERPITTAARASDGCFAQDNISKQPGVSLHSSAILVETEKQERAHSSRETPGSLGGSLSDGAWSRGKVNIDENGCRPGALFEGQGIEVGLVGR